MSSYLQKRKAALFPLNEKKREINEQITLLKEKQELQQRYLEEVGRNLEAARKMLQETDESLDEFGASNHELLSLYSDQINAGIAALQEFESVVSGYSLVVKAFEGKIEQEKKQIEELKQKQEELRRSITRDATMIAQQWKDLNIYKDRLQKFIDESGAPIKMRFLNE